MKLNELSILREEDHNPPYVWYSVEQSETLVARVKTTCREDSVTIHFLTVLWHFERKGIGSFAVNSFKKKYKRIVADQVKFASRDFWAKLGFKPVPDSGDYLWEAESPCR